MPQRVSAITPANLPPNWGRQARRHFQAKFRLFGRRENGGKWGLSRDRADRRKLGVQPCLSPSSPRSPCSDWFPSWTSPVRPRSPAPRFPLDTSIFNPLLSYRSLRQIQEPPCRAREGWSSPQNATGLSFFPAASDPRLISSCVSRLVGEGRPAPLTLSGERRSRRATQCTAVAQPSRSALTPSARLPRYQTL